MVSSAFLCLGWRWEKWKAWVVGVTGHAEWSQAEGQGGRHLEEAVVCVPEPAVWTCSR